jgi:Zn-dependent protease with chaperone function
MNLVELFIIFIKGPSFVFYGDYLWFYVFFNEMHFINALILVIAHLSINLIRFQIVRPISNAILGKIDEDAEQLIRNKIIRDKLHNVSISYIINYPSINAFCYRKLNSCEIIISHHWFETDEAKNNFDAILEHEIAHAKAHHNLKRTLFNSFLFALSMCVVRLLSASKLFENYEFKLITSIACCFFIMRVSHWIQAWYNRTQEFEADNMALNYASKENMIKLLNFLFSQNPAEQIFANNPEWTRGTHPHISSRIQNILR